VKKQVTNRDVLNEAYDYEKPVAFSRGMLCGNTLYISGTASINFVGKSIYPNNFEMQAKRAFFNVKKLLESEGFTWKDVVKTTIYIKDISINYDLFNDIRNDFFEQEKVYPYPASVCVQATMCRPELLIEMDAIAIKE